MTTITVQQKSNLKAIAKGVLGKGVLKSEGNYYFDKSCVDFDILLKKSNMYTCGIKKATCDYYYLPNIDKEVAWCYETIGSSLFKDLAGKVGFYMSGKDIEIIVS
jgi:uncharacterized protein (DUF427 family)